jgi:hypothetical protein
MSMKWVGCPNHNLTHATSTSEKQSESHTTAYVAGDTSGWGCILMRNTLDIYEVDLL